MRTELRVTCIRTRTSSLSFRRSLRGSLDEAGLSAREIADYLGHDRVSMTQDVYVNRKTVDDSAAHALADMEPPT